MSIPTLAFSKPKPNIYALELLLNILRGNSKLEALELRSFHNKPYIDAFSGKALPSDDTV
jgi:hypothetical protein